MPSTDRLILSIVFRLRVEGNQKKDKIRAKDWLRRPPKKEMGADVSLKLLTLNNRMFAHDLLL